MGDGGGEGGRRPGEKGGTDGGRRKARSTVEGKEGRVAPEQMRGFDSCVFEKEVDFRGTQR